MMRPLIVAMAMLVPSVAAAQSYPRADTFRYEDRCVRGTWTTVGGFIVGSYYNKLSRQHEECVWDARTHKVLVARVARPPRP